MAWLKTDSCPIWALICYLERSMPWRSTSASSLCRSSQGIDETLCHPQSPGGSVKLFWSATHIPLHLSLSPTRLRHTSYDPWLHRSHSTDRPLWNIFCELVPGPVIIKYLWSICGTCVFDRANNRRVNYNKA